VVPVVAGVEADAPYRRVGPRIEVGLRPRCDHDGPDHRFGIELEHGEPLADQLGPDDLVAVERHLSPLHSAGQRLSHVVEERRQQRDVAGVATLLHDLDRVGEVVLVEVANGILRQCLERPHLGQLVATLREERSELFGRAVQGRDEFILHGGLLPALRNRRQPVPGLILADPEGFRQIIRCEGTLDVRDEWCQAWRLLVKRRVAEDGGAAVRFGSAGAPSSPSTNLSYRSRRGPRR